MKRVLRFIFPAIAVVLLLGACGGNDVKRDFADITTEEFKPDTLFERYKDSLSRYFGPLEQDLIRNYKRSQDQLNTQEEFYVFYRNTHTLKNNLKRTLQSHVEMLREGSMRELPSFEWFRELARGLVVGDVANSTSCDIFYDYDILLKYAEKTTGKADDEYTKLIRLCFENNHYYPVWVMNYPDQTDASCSRLGSGKHYIIMRQLLIAQESGDLFKKELARVKRLLYQDIFFRNEYCYSSKLAVKELQNILHKLDLKSNDKVLFQARIKQMEDAQRYGLQFNCQSEDCHHEKNDRPDL